MTIWGPSGQTTNRSPWEDPPRREASRRSPWWQTPEVAAEAPVYELPLDPCDYGPMLAGLIHERFVRPYLPSEPTEYRRQAWCTVCACAGPWDNPCWYCEEAS